jgi:hypothetical protein
MAKARQKAPFWRRGKPSPKYDVVLLHPGDRPKGERFETLADARKESTRSERLLRSFSGSSNEILEYLEECRAGHYECYQPFCPICARKFRRWFIGQLLRITQGQRRVHIYTVLLKEAPRDKINTLDPAPFRHLLRKRLKRAGLGNVPVIGGFEIVYRAKDKVWVLHANLVIIGGKRTARKKFKKSFTGDDSERPVVRAVLKNPSEQLSYILKFTTYHRPHAQYGPTKSKARPLNPGEHSALLKWMYQFGFQDFLFLVNVKRQRGTRIVLSRPATKKDFAR